MKGNGDCFEVAGNLIVNLKDCKECYLCHGEPIGQGEIKDIKHAHAWIEINDVVIDLSNGKKFVFPKDYYYSIGKIKEKEVIRYTPLEAMKKMLETMNFGPWVIK